MRTEFATLTFQLVPRITAKFGEINDIHKTPHTGIDFSCPVSTPIYAPVDGIVSRVTLDHPKLGKSIFVKTETGYQYIIGHLSEIKVNINDTVHSGDLLALSGNSGFSTGPHLHFSVMDKLGHFVDPSILFRKMSGLYQSITNHAIVAYSYVDAMVNVRDVFQAIPQIPMAV